MKIRTVVMAAVLTAGALSRTSAQVPSGHGAFLADPDDNNTARFYKVSPSTRSDAIVGPPGAGIVPEPSPVALVGAGIGLVLLRRGG